MIIQNIMVKQTGYFTFLLIFIGLSSITLKAQQSQEDALLPDINPQDIEIRGEFSARFRGLRRQPILGFNPNPPIYQVDPNRLPFMETPEQIVANVPVSVLRRPAPPSLKLMTFPEQGSLYSSIGFGRFSSPEGEVYGNISINEKSGLLVDGQFTSSDGHFDDPQTSYRYFDGEVTWLARPEDNKSLRVTAGGLSDFNHTFNIGNQTIVPETPEKEYTGFHGDIHYRTLKNSFTGWDIKANVKIFNTDLLASQLSGENDETIFGGSIRKQWAGSNLNEVFSVKFGGLSGDYETDNGADDNWSTISGNIRYKRTFSSNTTIDLAVKFFLSDNELEDSEVDVLPDVTLTHWFTDKLKTSVIVKGDVFALSNQQHHQTNRFLNTSLDIKHTRILEGIARADYQLFEGTVLKGGLSYMDGEDYAFYLRPGIGGSLGFFDAFYGDVSIVKGFLGFTHYFKPETFWVDVETAIQNRDLDESDFAELSEIPFQEKFSTKATLSYDSGKSFSANIWGDIVSSRFSPQTSEDLDSFFMLGARADYEFGNHLGIYLKAVNLLDEEFEIWQGFEERPFQLYGGITFRL